MYGEDGQQEGDHEALVDLIHFSRMVISKTVHVVSQVAAGGSELGLKYLVVPAACTLPAPKPVLADYLTSGARDQLLFQQFR